MRHPDDRSRLRSIPSVDELLATSELERLRGEFPRLPWTHLVRLTVDAFRDGAEGRLPDNRDAARRAIVAAVERRVERLRRGGVQPVINATGVILHTNLGRALLGEAVREAVATAMANYVNLELDLSSGARGGRGEVLHELICAATEAEGAMVVNNNAAAVYLVVNSLSPPGRVLVSRGELVEIGGSFRLPDILAAAASEVVEVGTTNRTYASDYAEVAREGDVLLRAHRSNYDVTGFTHDATLAELVALGRERGCTVVYDLGSGSLFDFAAHGIAGEEMAWEVVRAGVDCVTMSGDKLLGGVQAGIILAAKKVLDRIGQNPLRRAVRIDKITTAAMQALMRDYLFGGEPARAVPALAQATVPVARLQERAQAIVAAIDATPYRAAVVDDTAVLGGGSFANQELPSSSVCLHCGDEASATRLAARLRAADPPVIARVRGEEVRLNLRSVPDAHDAILARVLSSCSE